MEKYHANFAELVERLEKPTVTQRRLRVPEMYRAEKGRAKEYGALSVDG